MTMPMPKFLENEEWYTKSYDENGDTVYELTEAAPPEAVKSFQEFYGPIDLLDDEGNSIVPEGWTVVA